jgi:hypothetical protein
LRKEYIEDLSDVLLPKLSKGDILVYILLHPQPASPRIEKRWVGAPAPSAKKHGGKHVFGFSDECVPPPIAPKRSRKLSYPNQSDP